MPDRLKYAAFSRIVPERRRLGQGDGRRGHVFLWWTVGTLLVAPLVLALGIPVWLIVTELVLVTLWSAVSAFARHRDERHSDEASGAR
ncbi:MAG: hypothetical protein ABIT38_02080 [Gemmatimonadaceae bacterium]